MDTAEVRLKSLWPNKFLFTYKSSVIKLIVSIVWLGLFICALIYIISGDIDINVRLNGIYFLGSIIGLFVSLFFVDAYAHEIAETCDNRKLRILKSMDIDTIKSERYTFERLYGEIAELYPLLYSEGTYVVKNAITTYIIGWVGKNAAAHDRDYYYIHDIRNGRVGEIIYRDFDQFAKAVDQMNDNRDTIEVVSRQIVPVPGKRRYAKYFV